MSYPSDYDVCDEHEAAYLKGGYCLECRILELEAELAEKNEWVQEIDALAVKLQAQLKAVQDEIHALRHPAKNSVRCMCDICLTLDSIESAME
jgi:uncharacterized coiled-coil protein SlyX